MQRKPNISKKYTMKRKIIFFLTAIASLLASAQATAEFRFLKSGINLIVVSDIGRNGYYDQKKVAELMGRVAEQTSPDAILALGDTHHYQGVQSVDDPLWMTNYELIYSHPELQTGWYPVLGNHEYRGNTQAVIAYSDKSRRWKMPTLYYAKTFKGDRTTLKVVFLDTPSLIDKYRKNPDTYPDAGQQGVETQLQWLENTLSDATEDWIVVVGHHPIYAYTDKEESERTDMQKRVDGILRKHRVEMYICGHLHNFQHIRRSGSEVDYVVNSSGSLSRTAQEGESTLYSSGEPGFSFLSVSSDTLRLYMIDKNGTIIHTVTRKHKQSTSHFTEWPKCPAHPFNVF